MSSSVFPSNINLAATANGITQKLLQALARCHWWWSVVALCHHRQSIVAFPNFIARRNRPLCGLHVSLYSWCPKLAFWVRDKYAASNNALPVCCLKHQASPTPGSTPLALSCQSDPRHPFISTEIPVFLGYLFWGERVQILALGCLGSVNYYYCTSLPWVLVSIGWWTKSLRILHGCFTKHPL